MERFVFIGKTTEFSCSASIPPGFSESVAFAWEKDDSKTIENSIQVFPCYFFIVKISFGTFTCDLHIGENVH